MDTDSRKNHQLGMDYSTATHYLRKMVVFNMAVRLGEDSCFRCGEKIRSCEELSFDHKRPWLDVSVDLFWDLENIAFSHKSCNSRFGRKPRRIYSSAKERKVEECKRVRLDPVRNRRMLDRKIASYHRRKCVTSPTAEATVLNTV